MVNAATVKNINNAKYYKKTSTPSIAGKFTDVEKLNAKAMSNGFVKFKRNKKVHYINIADVRVKGKFNAEIVNDTEVFDDNLKPIGVNFNANKKVTVRGVKVDGTVVYLKIAKKKYIKASEVVVKSFEYKNPNIALSTDLMGSKYFNFDGNTHKQLDGYLLDYKLHKNYKFREMNALNNCYSRIVSENGKVLYKTLNNILEIITKYGDEVIFCVCKQAHCYKAVNVKTGEIRDLYQEDDKYLCAPMFYKNKMYYIKGDGKEGEVDTPKGYISVANIDGEHIKHIKIPNFTKEKKFLGIAYDKFYYTSGRKECSVIECCDLDGSNYKIVAKGFKLRYKISVNNYNNFTFDNSGWYFQGGNKKPYNNLCKLNFKTGKVKIIKKNFCSSKNFTFDVYGKYVYYRNSKNKYIYRLSMKTGKTRIFVKRKIERIAISGKYLYFKKAEYPTWYRLKIDGIKKTQKIELVCDTSR